MKENKVIIDLMKKFLSARGMKWNGTILENNEWIVANDSDFGFDVKFGHIICVSCPDGVLMLKLAVDPLLFIISKYSYGMAGADKYNDGDNLVAKLLEKLTGCDLCDEWQEFIEKNTPIEDGPVMIDYYTKELEIKKKELEKEVDYINDRIEELKGVLAECSIEDEEDVKEDISDYLETLYSTCDGYNNRNEKITKIVKGIVINNLSPLDNLNNPIKNIQRDEKLKDEDFINPLEE